MNTKDALTVLDHWIDMNNINRPRGHNKVQMDVDLEQAHVHIARQLEDYARLVKHLNDLTNGGPYDLTDSPKSFINNIRKTAIAAAGEE
jgi:hypothetical protein